MSGKNTEKHDCDYFETLINKRLDGDITPDENAELNSHLAVCEFCTDELISYEMVRSILDESSDNMIEVPEGFFESLDEQLAEIEHPRGFKGIIENPFFNVIKGYALAAASFLLVGILTAGVAYGFLGGNGNDQNGISSNNSGLARIHANNGQQIILTDETADGDRYAAALDDLERAYREQSGQNTQQETSGYIHTSWSGGDKASPIH